MHVARLTSEDDYDGWRTAARAFAIAGVDPADIAWQVGDAPADLFAAAPDPLPAPSADPPAFSVPRAFLDLAETVVCHADPERFALLYTLLIRLRSHPKLMEDRADALVGKLEGMARLVRRDIHKMRAFLRFRTTADDAGERYVAWWEPDHHIVRANAGFFVRRFASMRWSILTPELSIHWDGETLTEGPGATRADAPDSDPVEDTWKAYYASIFNPARLKPGMMLREMPRKYWANMFETALVPGLIAGAQAREAGMIAADRTSAGGNALAAWAALKEEALACRRCPLWKPANDTVFGEGPVDARLMLVGEQPGDQEDLQGRPFVGPAGQLLDRALGAAGIDRASIYIANAVKHFKFEQRGPRRIHSKPNTGEIEACRWWIDQERMIIRPAVVVALGATAAHSLMGRQVTISRTRGEAHAMDDGAELWVTVHPSFLLRVDDKARAEEEYRRFVADLMVARERAELLG